MGQKFKHYQNSKGKKPSADQQQKKVKKEEKGDKSLNITNFITVDHVIASEHLLAVTLHGILNGREKYFFL